MYSRKCIFLGQTNNPRTSHVKLYNSRLTTMLFIFRQIYVWRTLILVKMEVTARQTVTGHPSHAVVPPDILVTTADISKVIHTVKKQSKYRICTGSLKKIAIDSVTLSWEYHDDCMGRFCETISFVFDKHCWQCNACLLTLIKDYPAVCHEFAA